MIHEETVINDNYEVKPGMPEKIIKSSGQILKSLSKN